MAEIAEMMLDGTLCQHCGEPFKGPGMGFPRSCTWCRQLDPRPYICECGKRFGSKSARRHHRRKEHP